MYRVSLSSKDQYSWHKIQMAVKFCNQRLVKELQEPKQFMLAIPMEVSFKCQQLLELHLYQREQQSHPRLFSKLSLKLFLLLLYQQSNQAKLSLQQMEKFQAPLLKDNQDHRPNSKLYYKPSSKIKISLLGLQLKASSMD